MYSHGFFLLFAVSPRFSCGRPCLSVLEVDEAGCCCPHALSGGVVSVPRTCVALFLSLLVRCYVSTVVYVTLVLISCSIFFGFLSVPAACAFAVALLDLALDAAARPLRQRPSPWQIRLSLAERSSALRPARSLGGGVSRSDFIACSGRSFRALRFIYLLTDTDVYSHALVQCSAAAAARLGMKDVVVLAQPWMR